MKILITSGGTKEPIDSVRYITNMSKGKFGASLARIFYVFGEEVLLFRAEDAENVEEVRQEIFNTYDDYSAMLQYHVADFKPDVVIAAAAVGDFIVDRPYIGQKIPSRETFHIDLKAAPKVLPLIKKINPDIKVVGFKLLVNATYQEMRDAAYKVLFNGCDMVAANDLINKENPYYELFYPIGSIKLEPGADLAQRFAERVIELCEIGLFGNAETTI